MLYIHKKTHDSDFFLNNKIIKFFEDFCTWKLREASPVMKDIRARTKTDIAGDSIPKFPSAQKFQLHLKEHSLRVINLDGGNIKKDDSRPLASSRVPWIQSSLILYYVNAHGKVPNAVPAPSPSQDTPCFARVLLTSTHHTVHLL